MHQVTGLSHPADQKSFLHHHTQLQLICAEFEQTNSEPTEINVTGHHYPAAAEKEYRFWGFNGKKGYNLKICLKTLK